MVLPDSHRVSRALWYSGTLCAAIRFRLRDYHPLWSNSPRRVRLSNRRSRTKALQPQTTEVVWFGLFPVRSPLLGESQLISLPQGTEMFHFPWFAPHDLCIQSWVTEVHSCWVSPFGYLRIKACLSAPRSLTQTYHVLHRLLVPRHPPCALNSLALQNNG